MSVLSDHEIRRLVAATELIDPFDEYALQGASYDMAIGELIVVGGVPRTMTRSGGGHNLEPGDFIVLTTHERLKMPADLIGHNGIMSTWARSGLVSLFSPQIDPGFVGVLEVPIFNSGDAAVRLLPGDHIFTIEFVKMSKPASFLWVDRWGPKSPPSQPLPPKAVRSNLRDIADLRSALEEAKAQQRETEQKVVGRFGTVDLAQAEARASINELRAAVGALEKVVSGTTANKSLKASRWNLAVAAIAVVFAAATIVLTVLLAT